MKRNIYLLSALAGMAIFATSCSDDDSNSNNNRNSGVELFTSSNTSGTITITDLSSPGGGEVTSLTNGNEDGDGIFYDPTGDYIIQASRTKNRLNIYGDIQNHINTGAEAVTLVGNSPNDDFSNAREIAIAGDNVFVVEDQSVANGMMNKIHVFKKNGLVLSRIRTYTTDFKLWGIHAEGANLYAVVDNTGDFVRFDDILTKPEGAIAPNKRLTVEGLVRTHGITYSAQDDTMILTDIGNATVDNDGGLIVLSNFTTLFNGLQSGQTINLAQQKRIYGSNTSLGNPVDVAYDYETNNIYVAERLNGGGKVLTFSSPTTATSDIVPVHARSEAGVSAVYFSRR